MDSTLDIASEVAGALREGRPLVALESALITHGLPWPINLETARAAEAAVRAEGAVPATVAVFKGRLRIGLGDSELEELARARDVSKASRRDLAAMIAQGRTAGTTVSATLCLAHRAGIRAFATGGIGGVHRGAGRSFDISADLIELARTPVCVVCAGAKAILDIPATLEVLESLEVPVVGYRTSEFPAFYLPSSGEPVEVRADSPEEVAAILDAHWRFTASAVVVAQAPPASHALSRIEFETALARAEADARSQQIKGKALTPFLLARLAELTQGKTLDVNRTLVVANARLAAQISRASPLAA